MFTHLHVHTEYSLLDGLSRLDSLLEQSKKLGMNSIGITDHGGLYGAIHFYRKAVKLGIKPIIGCEMYVARKSRFDKIPSEKSPYHLTVLAKNNKGYSNLVQLVSLANLEGFYYKPRVDRELLAKYSEGLIVLSGCPSGEVPELISQGNIEQAKETANWYKTTFGDYYLEIMNHDHVDDLPAINSGLINLHKELNLPVVATNDSHYVKKEDADYQDLLVCIHTNTNVNDNGRLRMEDNSYYLKSPDEMASLFKDVPEAISNTMKIADECDVKIDLDTPQLPKFKTPDNIPAEQYLSELCWEGLKNRIDNITHIEEERLKKELDVIIQTRYADYFLVVWDITHFANKSDIKIAVRGSAAGSLVLYSLGVTNINPLEYNIVFERFLNLERKEMPDIDMDFQDDRRSEVIDYVVNKYGKDHVAQIITFGTMGARASIRDVGRALAIPYPDVDRIAKLIPTRLNITIEEAISETSELKEIIDSDSDINKIVKSATYLEGTIRHSSTHAAGVVISENPLNEYVPLQKPTKGEEGSVSMTQYDMDSLSALGLLKMDFLGLINLTILSKTIELVKLNHGIDLDLDSVPLNDVKTFDLLSNGETSGVFQLEGSGMTRYIKDLKPTSLMDVAAMIALYRPGPMEHIDTFIKAKHGQIEVKYLHQILKDVTEETYGVIVYQDQVFFIAQSFAGYSMGEADILRKAMGKKIPEIMAAEKDKFISGAIDNGHPKDLAEKVFALIEPFAGYGFPKAHSVSYGLISYWTGYFKANYPIEYMVCLLNAYSGNSDKLSSAVSECNRLGIKILQPDINSSEIDFSIESNNNGDKSVRFGLGKIKNVGALALTDLIKSRDTNNKFKSIEDMCENAKFTQLNKKTLESLVKVGAFDSINTSRNGILSSIDKIISLAQESQSLKNSSQTSMFDMFGDTVEMDLSQINIPEIETTDTDKQDWENELLGVNLSTSNKLNHIIASKNSQTIASINEINENLVRKKITIAGQISQVMQRQTREGKPFLIVTLALLNGDIDIFVWDNVINTSGNIWKHGSLIELVGTVRAKNGEMSISCSSAKLYEYETDHDVEPSKNETIMEPAESIVQNGKSKANGAVTSQSIKSNNSINNGVNGENGNHKSGKLIISLKESSNQIEDHDLLKSIASLCAEFKGDSKIEFHIITKHKTVIMEWPLLKVEMTDLFKQKIEALLGQSGSITIS